MLTLRQLRQTASIQSGKYVGYSLLDYDTYTGRWTAPYPMGEAGGEPDWYGYCQDDPVNGLTKKGGASTRTPPFISFIPPYRVTPWGQT